MALPAQAALNPFIENYRILDRIACGGMGVVYKGFDLSLQRTVALKFLSPDRVLDTAERNRLLREARAASVLDHENIAAIHHVGETADGQLFIDMGYYEGEDLATRMRHAPLTTPQALDIITQVARGLAHAHAHDVIHRDIKPANVILTHDGVAKIVDFGLAHVVSPEASTVSLNLSGTLAYMSPEQLTGKVTDARSDIWSLGVVLYELLAHRPAFGGDSTANVVNAILNAEPAHMNELPADLEPIVRRALQKDPDRRFQTCAEMLRHLELLNSSSAHVTVELPEAPSPRHFNWAVVRWLVTLMVVLLVAMLYPPALNRSPEPARIPASAATAIDLYQQGIAFLERYDKPQSLQKAIDSFEQTRKLDPKFALAYTGLAEAYVDRFRQEQNPDSLVLAEQQCKTAFALNNQLPEVHIMMGRIHDITGAHDLGLQEIMRGLQLDPNNVKGQLALGDAYANVNRNDEAETAYLRAIALRQDNWDAYLRHGSFYIRLQRNEEAAAEYRKAIALAPDNARAHANLAAALLNLSRIAEADAEIKLALQSGPNYTTYYNLAWAYFSDNRFAAAATMAEKAAELNHDDYRVWQMLGVTYEWIGEQKKARQAYAEELKALQKAETVKAEDADAQSELGLLYSKLQRRPEAMRRVKTALALAPDKPYVLAAVGEIYENFGERELAIQYIEKSMQNGWDLERIKRNPDMRSFLADPAVQKRLSAISKGPKK